MHSIMWFRDDLRIQHNEALYHAARQGKHSRISAVYVLEEHPKIRPLGGASRWWLHHSLVSLAHTLASHGVPLVVLRGDATKLIPQLANELGATYISWSRRYHHPGMEIDAAIKSRLRNQGVAAHSFEGFLLTEPWRLTTSTNKPYQVFTPYSRKAFAELADELGTPPTAALSRETIHNLKETLRAIDGLDLLPQNPDWASGFHQHWTPGESGAHERFDHFLKRVPNTGYATARDFPAQDATSGLSPHLRFGEISPLYVWQAIATAGLKPEDVSTFRKELLWRDFAWNRLYHRPDMSTTSVREEFRFFPWRWAEAQDADLRAWQRGNTGFPLVDAGMRELWTTGTMHNRVRMIVGSFLTKNLLLHWRHGEQWFWDTLLDADPASNPFNWQWVAGCGDDAAPYFRIFNPETQAKRFDPLGTYISRWAPKTLLPGLGAYEPIVDFQESRQCALDAYNSLMQAHTEEPHTTTKTE